MSPNPHITIMRDRLQGVAACSCLQDEAPMRS